MLGLSGRSLFKLKLFDRWDLLSWFWGGPRTGKTTFCKVLTSFTDRNDLGCITCGTEETFGLSFLFRKKLVGMFDLRVEKNRCGVSEAELTLMIGGESVSLANKCKDAKPNAQWTAPMLANANCLPVPTLFKDKVSHPSPPRIIPPPMLVLYVLLPHFILCN